MFPRGIAPERLPGEDETNMEEWMRRLGRFVRQETVLCVALGLGAVSCLAVPPDAGYADYVDWDTLAMLFSLMAVMRGFQDAGLFEWLGGRLLRRAANTRQMLASAGLRPDWAGWLAGPAFAAGAAALASLALPWYPLSCWLFAAALALLGVGAFLARRQDPDLNRGWKFAIAAILAHGACPAVVAWQDGALRLLAVLVDVVLLYLSVTLAVTGLVRGGGAGGQPPRPVVIFEYTAGAYALLQLAADAFPQFATPATVISMCALCFGFVQMVRYLIKEKPAGKTAG